MDFGGVLYIVRVEVNRLIYSLQLLVAHLYLWFLIELYHGVCIFTNSLIRDMLLLDDI